MQGVSLTNKEFQNHYAVLGVERSASTDVIAQAYQALAQRYHPNTPRTGDRAMYAKVTMAYDILSDPGARAEFDKAFQGAADRPEVLFTGEAFFDSVRVEGHRRVAVLSVLYDHRRRNPFTPSLSLRELEGVLAFSPDELSFSLWFLKQRGLAVSDDKSSIQITVDGMEYVERKAPEAAEVMAFIRRKAE